MPRSKKLQPEVATKVREWSVTRIQDELDRLIKIFSHMRECFENEMYEGLGIKKMTVTDRQMRQGQELAAMMSKMVDAKIRYEKASKLMAEVMTPEEERHACTKYIQSLEPEVRRAWVDNLNDWRRARAEDIYANEGHRNPRSPTGGYVARNELVPPVVEDEPVRGDDTE